MQASSALRIVKLVHTVIWAFFASCVLAIPVFAWHEETAYAALLVGIVFVEVLALAFNRWRCPLTPIAARYTAQRGDSFDIYLPVWLAGVLYLAGLLYTLARYANRA